MAYFSRMLKKLVAVMFHPQPEDDLGINLHFYSHLNIPCYPVLGDIQPGDIQPGDEGGELLPETR
jgi:hypothetical protein